MDEAAGLARGLTEPEAPARDRPDRTSDTRERIVALALKVFAERGFDGAKTREIAHRADVNLGLIKYYFDTKEGLWKAAVDRAFEELRQGLQDVLGDSGQIVGRDGLEQAIRGYVRFVADHPEFGRLMQDESKRDGTRMRWLVEQHVRPLYDEIRNGIEPLQERGLLPPMPAASFHYFLVGAAGAPFIQRPEFQRLTGLDPTSKDFVEAHADALVRLLLGPESA